MYLSSVFAITAAAFARADADCGGTTVVPALVTVQTIVPEQYIVRVVDQSLLDEMIDICNGVAPPRYVGIGLVTGNAGHNHDPLNGTIWSWRAAEGAVGLGNMCAEIYDGVPSFVEGNLEYWVETVGAFCPWTGQIVAIAEDSSIPGDFDIDGDVDSQDFSLFQSCFAGPQTPCYDLLQGCCATDMDGDADIDCADWGAFVQHWTEPGDPPDLPACAAGIPAVSAWGLVTLTLLGMTCGTILLRSQP